MQPSQVMVMNIVLTAVGVALGLFVNVRYGVLLKKCRGSINKKIVKMKPVPEQNDRCGFPSKEVIERNRIMNTVKVRNIEIGAGIPKICVPIVGVTREEILAAAETIKSTKADVVEWRVDWYEDIFDFAKTEETMKALREVLGETPILFTFRTSKEGGEKSIETGNLCRTESECGEKQDWLTL